MKRNRGVLVVVAVMALCGLAAEGMKLFQPPRERSPRPVIEEKSGLVPPGSSLRICTYNIEHFSDGINDGEHTEELALQQARLAAAILEKVNPDILVLQEMENVQALRLLNGAFKNPYPLGYISTFRDRKGNVDPLNIAVLSRVPLIHVREILFQWMEWPVPPRGSLAFSVDLEPGRRLQVYAVHLKSNFGDSAKNQVQRSKALEAVASDAQQRMAEKPEITWEVVLAGDMNVDPENPEFKDDLSLAGLDGWIDLWKGRPMEERMTIPTRFGDPALEFPPAAFDRVYVLPELTSFPWRVKSLDRLPEGVATKDVTIKPGREGHVSDHYPVFLDIERGPQD